MGTQFKLTSDQSFIANKIYLSAARMGLIRTAACAAGVATVTLLCCIVSVLYLMNDISKFYNEAIEDLLEFKVSAPFLAYLASV